MGSISRLPKSSGEARQSQIRSLGVVSTFGAEVGDSFLIDYVTVLSLAVDQLDVITPSTTKCDLTGVRFHTQKYIREGHGFMRAIREVSWQLRVSYRLASLGSRTGHWVFFGAEGLVLPMLAAKILRKHAVLALAGNMEREAALKGGVLRQGYGLLKRINCRLADRMILYSERLIEEWHLQRYRKKTVIAARHFVDLGRFQVTTAMGSRGSTIGCIGRLSREKGVLHFLEAIPRLVAEGNEVAFLIGGDGPLRRAVDKYAENSNNKIEYGGWIPHDGLPHYLNRVKLLVLPSYTEGLPNIMLEAMACGTPVLATPVGAIPDIIVDGETGFIMPDNSPECIAQNILRALSHPDLEQIAQKGRILVEREFTLEKAVARYRRALSRLA